LLTYIASHPAIQGVPDPVERLAVLARFVGINNPSPRHSVDAFVGRIRSIQKEIGEPLSLRDAGITEDQMMREIETLVRIAEKDPNMYTTPCECKGKALRDLFELMWRG
jgi:alcohol dehydrogenase class IV